LELIVEFLRARRERPYALMINDPRPVESVADIWGTAAQLATIGIFLLLAVVGLYFGRPILLPILAALVVGTTLAPVIRRAEKFGISSWVTGVVLVLVLLAMASLLVTLLAGPIGEWIAKAPEIGASVRQKLYVLDRPLAALRDLQNMLAPSSGPAVKLETSQIAMVAPVVTLVTPAVAQILVFFVTLTFFLGGQLEFRKQLAAMFTSREARLRFIRITNDVEHNLASYLAVLTVINFTIGTIVAIGAWLFGFPNPVIFGAAAMLLNYIPYIGPACMTFILFAVGLVTFPSLGYALVPPACFIALSTIEGQIVTPTVLGRRLTLRPFAVFLSLAFWAWLWGPMGAFLAVPLSIIGLVTIHHLFPGEEAKIPG
jgi:predicted PurR-regulated permease PerM